jgi:hypothetical protein
MISECYKATFVLQIGMNYNDKDNIINIWIDENVSEKHYKKEKFLKALANFWKRDNHLIHSEIQRTPISILTMAKLRFLMR